MSVTCIIETCEQTAPSYPSRRGLCGKHFTRWYRHGDPLYARESHDLLERCVARIDPGVCWEWTGTLSNGYGVTYYEGRQQKAHRVVWQLLVGAIPNDLEFDHLCRNRACVNPDHLELVTHRENVRRGAAATRQATCKRGHNDWFFEGKIRRCHTCRRANRALRQRDRTDQPEENQ